MSADRDAYRLISEKAPAVDNMELDFTIEPTALPLLEEFPTAENLDEYIQYMGESVEDWEPPRMISLEKALAIAFESSRTHQARKENLYVQALGLTLTRRDYNPIFAGFLSGDLRRTTRDVTRLSDEAEFAVQSPELVRAVGNLAGTPADLLNAYAELVASATRATGATAPDTTIDAQRTLSGQTSLQAGLLLKGGGRLALQLSSDFFRFLTGNSRESASSTLSGTFSQPIIGQGTKTARETLTQAERNLLYGLRTFTRTRKTFAVQIASNYYRVLQDRDTVRTNWQRHLSARRNLERAQAEFAEDLQRLVDLGRFEQQQISAERSWIQSIRNYRQSLDVFKIELGLPPDAPVILDEKELTSLMEGGLDHPSITAEEAAQVALVTRLDLQNQRDQLEDVGRGVEIAASALYPDVSVVLGTTVASLSGNPFEQFDFNRAIWNAGLDFDPKLDRTAERNSYRRSLIAYEQARRQLEEFEDGVRLDARQGWRDLDEARSAYESNVRGVELNERTYEEQEMTFDLLGTISPIDLIDALNEFTDAQNARTRSMVDHKITKLGFWRDMGILYIKKNGQWEDLTDE